MEFAVIITKSPFKNPYRVHNERPAISDIMSHLDTSSASFVFIVFLIWGTVLHSVKNVAIIPTINGMYSVNVMVTAITEWSFYI